MNRLIYPLICLLWLSGFSTGFCQNPTTLSLSGKIIVKSSPALNPVLRGLDANPILCIKVYVPEGKAPINYKQIHCTLNADIIKTIEKLEIFFNGAEPLLLQRIV
jgi:hypothetical protein